MIHLYALIMIIYSGPRLSAVNISYFQDKQSCEVAFNKIKSDAEIGDDFFSEAKYSCVEVIK